MASQFIGHPDQNILLCTSSNNEIHNQIQCDCEIMMGCVNLEKVRRYINNRLILGVVF